MKAPFIFAFCVIGVLAGCVVGSAWFGVLMFMESKDWHVIELMPLFVFDSIMFGWFPALLFGAILYAVMLQFGWMKLWQWALVGACMAWTFFFAGGWIAKWDKSDGYFFLVLGVGLLHSLSKHTWPAAICGAITASLLQPLGVRLANPPTWSFERRI